MGGILLVTFCFLIAGVIAVPLASWLGLGSVLGYLIAGIVLSPIMQALHIDVVSIQHIAEFGVVMMLFLVGLELDPRSLWKMKHRLLGLGGLQVGLTVAAITGVAMLFGQPWSIALAIGLVLSLSSTAIVLQTLNEKGLMKSDGGQASFSVLLFQDIAVIPMLALIPLLAMPELMDVAVEQVATDTHGHGDGHGDQGGGFTDTLNGWQRALVTVVSIAGIVVAGHFMIRPVFRFIALANLREIFTATALLIVIGIALLMTLIGLSPALGTFLAGVVLANSEYRHELESDIEPFKGLLLGLFFMTVGATINFTLLFENLAVIVGLTLGLIALKALILLALSFIFKVRDANRYLLALGLAQAGEFGFVLLSFTTANSVIPASVADRLLLVVALFIVYDKLIAPKYATQNNRPADEIDEAGDIIIAGHGRFGGIVNRLLSAYSYKTVVVDIDSEQLEALRKFGYKLYFGDATRPDLLHSAGIEQAKLLVIAIDDEHQCTELARYVNQNYPEVHVVARAVNRQHVYELYAAGAEDIIRDTFDSATRAGRSALEALGLDLEEAQKKTDDFIEFDKFAMRYVAEAYDSTIPWQENKVYIEKVKEVMALQDKIMDGDTSAFEIKT